MFFAPEQFMETFHPEDFMKVADLSHTGLNMKRYLNNIGISA
ncbi:hypothetical protein SAMN02745176_01405 [Lutispora thermophila DSM 19022]|mgnify:CR=1 FL=1|uniref:Uncharacterized protein n=1 Tax=Lutispora thermophila DSM 19022 TaxID=1122184 RepID=A0A1M6E3U9_9FIRM|nr:hypothetical protein SAMN02745176_01405 [Lutispora thermophila DSM 19022]